MVTNVIYNVQQSTAFNFHPEIFPLTASSAAVPSSLSLFTQEWEGAKLSCGCETSNAGSRNESIQY